jgi:hypothetical protein
MAIIHTKDENYCQLFAWPALQCAKNFAEGSTREPVMSSGYRKEEGYLQTN